MPRTSDRELGGLCNLGGFRLQRPSGVRGPDDKTTIALAQDYLCSLGYLDLSAFTDRDSEIGELRPKTRAAIEAYKRAKSIRGNTEQVIDRLIKEWVAQREPERQAQEDRARQLLKHLLESLPGPAWSAPVLWNDIRLVVDKWLMLHTEPGERNGVPLICVNALREFSLVERRLWERVPQQERQIYLEPEMGGRWRKPAKNIPALVMFWIRDEAKEALKKPHIKTFLKELHEYGASARLLLVLSFVPNLVFATLSLRARIRRERSKRKDLLAKYHNPKTRLSYDDPWAAIFLKLRDAGDPLVSGCTDDEIREMVARSLTSLPRDRGTPDKPRKGEQVIWSSVGLDKIPPSGLANTRLDDFRKVPLKTASMQEIWDYIFFPLVEYLVPFAPRRKDIPGITPEHVYGWASRLVYYRSRGLWGDRPDLLKQRYLGLRY